MTDRQTDRQMDGQGDYYRAPPDEGQMDGQGGYYRALPTSSGKALIILEFSSKPHLIRSSSGSPLAHHLKLFLCLFFLQI